MPDGLLRTPAPPIQHASRILLLPLSIAAHALLFATCFVVTVMADVTLPVPAPRRALYEATPAIPVFSEPRQTRQADPAHQQASRSEIAPIAAPDQIVDRQNTGGAEIVDPLPGEGAPDGWVAIGTPVDGFVPPPPPPPPPPHAPVRLSGGLISAPRKVHDVTPVYPPIAQSARVEGVVVLEVIIERDGRVRQAHVLQSIPLLDRAAVSAVEQWVFTPTRLNGEAVPVVMTVTVDFKLR